MFVVPSASLDPAQVGRDLELPLDEVVDAVEIERPRTLTPNPSPTHPALRPGEGRPRPLRKSRSAGNALSLPLSREGAGWVGEGAGG